MERLGDEGLGLARQLAMTTYRSEADFAERFGRSAEPDGRPSIVSYLDHQGRKLIERFDGDTYRVLAGAMDRHDVGAGRGGDDPGVQPASAPPGTRVTGVGIEGDILYGPAQVRELVDAARERPAWTPSTARSAPRRATTRSSSSGTSSERCLREALDG